MSDGEITRADQLSYVRLRGQCPYCGSADIAAEIGAVFEKFDDEHGEFIQISAETPSL